MSGVQGGFVVACGLFFGIFVNAIFWDCGLDLLVCLLVVVLGCVVFVDLDPGWFFLYVLLFFILGLWWTVCFFLRVFFGGLSSVVFLVFRWLLFWIEFVVFCLRG